MSKSRMHQRYGCIRDFDDLAVSYIPGKVLGSKAAKGDRGVGMDDPGDFGKRFGHGHVKIIVVLKSHDRNNIGVARDAIHLGHVWQVGDLLRHGANFAGKRVD